VGFEEIPRMSRMGTDSKMLRAMFLVGIRSQGIRTHPRHP
jgi:hypothetical protein